jgi:hypothetical protein
LGRAKKLKGGFMKDLLHHRGFVQRKMIQKAHKESELKNNKPMEESRAVEEVEVFALLPVRKIQMKSYS